MSEYKAPIRISNDDPVCSATALQGTVIGILFEKTGDEIKKAIDKSAVTIDGEIEKHQKTINEAKGFLETKTKELKVIDEVYEERKNHKKAKLQPFYRKIDELKCQITNTGREVDLETDKIVAERACKFQDKFEDYKPILMRLDEFLKNLNYSTSSSSSSSASSESPWFAPAGSGPEGVQGCQGSIGGTMAPGVYYSTTGEACEISEDEENALARLNTLRRIVAHYTSAVNQIKRAIECLKEERRRLILIKKHIGDRTYKLDLNKLSAFGFEDVEIV